MILQLNFSCKTQYSITELNNNFTSEQVSDLNKISTFFKNQMCLNMDHDFKTCYEQIPHEYLQATGNGFWANIDFDKQKKLYKEISQSTFDEIWMFSKSTAYPSEIESKSIAAVANGKYYKYLKSLGNKNPRIAKYATQINASGDFSLLDIRFREVLKNKKYFDLKDPNIQLILAIHYLSLNDQVKRKDKWVTQ